ncbi:Hypothetical protein Bbr_0218 [Bifidobacterium breve UCC2003]|nr:Hypothetical protein Bbr_0218 [Bifidobacterium breve UCC2003]AHJ24115.1 Hypothetical protein BS27_0225a [Bifidobacterium breve S27]
MRKPRTPSAVNKLRLQKQLCRIRSLSQELLPSCLLRQNQAIATFRTNQTRRCFPPCPTTPIRGHYQRKRKICKDLRQANRHLNWQDGKMAPARTPPIILQQVKPTIPSQTLTAGRRTYLPTQQTGATISSMPRN